MNSEKKLSSTAGMTRSQIRAKSLSRRNCILAYLDRQGPTETNAIIAALKYERGSVFHWLRDMLKTGHVTMVNGDNGIRGKANVWSRGPNRTLLHEYSGDRTGKKYKDPSVTRKVIKAKQIGMKRDDLVAALFGAGPAVRA